MCSTMYSPLELVSPHPPPRDPNAQTSISSTGTPPEVTFPVIFPSTSISSASIFSAVSLDFTPTRDGRICLTYSSSHELLLQTYPVNSTEYSPNSSSRIVYFPPD